MFNLVLLFLAIAVLSVIMWWLGYYRQRIAGIVYAAVTEGTFVYLLINYTQQIDKGQKIFIGLCLVGWLIFLIDLWRKGKKEYFTKQKNTD
ncbi:hypothetical protein ACWOAH_09495 [Vagococcus vulneris]|uniref:Uncharacterized protein n=1 Tax=Vagococcus vulneris TaxID=1977869 RepID=A0A429ZUF0_9ENTE|nr:hypothetical protein [Vagococcus vulneris]RST97365.1 hypothetical protein CBF37_09795 [Vagococcus vulneris]